MNRVRKYARHWRAVTLQRRIQRRRQPTATQTHNIPLEINRHRFACFSILPLRAEFDALAPVMNLTIAYSEQLHV